MSRTRFFVHCPRGFANERSIKASDDDDVIKFLKGLYDDGMATTFEEITELEAKKLIYQKKVSPSLENAIHHIDQETANEVYRKIPKWEDLKPVMVIDAKAFVESISY